MNTTLALLGGKPAVSVTNFDSWKSVSTSEVKSVFEALGHNNDVESNFKLIHQFENEFAEFCGTKYCLAHNNGTAALYAAFFAANIESGDEVITPSYTWISSFAPAWHLGASIQFCDIDPKTLLIDPQDAIERITPRTKIILVPHLWGYVAPLADLLDVCREKDIILIEDASHAPGARWKNHPIGTLGAIGCFSLQGGKPISAGEGGVFVTDSLYHYERAVLLGQLNRVSHLLANPIYAEMNIVGLGMKFRPHPLGIALARSGLKRFSEMNTLREEWVAKLHEAFAPLPALQEPLQVAETKRGGYHSDPWIICPEYTEGVSKRTIVRALQAEGIPVRDDPYQLWHYHSIFHRPFMTNNYTSNHLVRKAKSNSSNTLPAAEAVFHRIIHFPVVTKPADGVLQQITDATYKVFDQLKQLRDVDLD